VQTDAILELKLYKLAKLEIHVIREEPPRRPARPRDQGLLKSEDKLWR